MVEVKKYHLPPTPLVPNSPHPLLHYPGYLLTLSPQHEDHVDHAHEEFKIPPVVAYDLFKKHSWQTQWVYRYASTQTAHYHSGTHECMAVLSGTAIIRFGAADIVPPNATPSAQAARAEIDPQSALSSTDSRTGTQANSNQDGKLGISSTKKSPHTPESEAKSESGGIEIRANVGDVFILPAGLAHKTYNASPEADFKLLTPGDGHYISTSQLPFDRNNGGSYSGDEDEARKILSSISLSGFTMMGAYPTYNLADNSHTESNDESETEFQGQWDFAQGGDISPSNYESVWKVPKPFFDPVLGSAAEGLCGLW